MSTIEELLSDYDWQEVFKYATPTAVLQDPVSTAPFVREDVVRIIGMVEGENDASNWVGVFELRDGRFASISAGCDYTGWG